MGGGAPLYGIDAALQSQVSGIEFSKPIPLVAFDRGALEEAVKEVLRGAATGKGSSRQFMTAYQVMDRLPEAHRLALVEKYKELGGKDSGVPFSAFTYVAQMMGMMETVEKVYMDTGGIQFTMENSTKIPVVPGYQVCALFRLA